MVSDTHGHNMQITTYPKNYSYTYKKHMECKILTFLSVFFADAMRTHPGPVHYTIIVRTAAITLVGAGRW